MITLYLLVISCTGVVAAPCGAADAREWVVSDSASATALAEAVNCSYGAFNVEWRGSVVVDRAIHIADGTSLRVSGSGSGATIEGGGDTQIFTVVGATLEVSNVHFRHAFAVFGGAIASDGSRLSFNNTSFTDNVAVERGGALSLSKGSTVSWGGLTTFSNNTAN